MRLFSIVVLVAGLVVAVGYTFLRDRAERVGSERDGGIAIAPETIEDETASDSDLRAAVLASLTGDVKSDDSNADDASGGPAKSAFYQWVDERGSVNFAASLDEVPVAWRERAGRIDLDAGSFTMTKSASSGGTLSRRPPPTPVAAPTAAREVVVYTAPWCGWCRKTLAFLDERGVDYVNKDIEADPEYESELREKTGGTAIPLVEIDGEQIRGYSADRMAALLD